MTLRKAQQIINGMPASDGAGVQLTRIIGSRYLDMLDPFLLLDHFGSDKPQDYIAGFPPHPHRGFETVTYMLEGRMRHKDSAGNEGLIENGGVQWMTAGKGIIHSEMPEQESGLMSGFQLWVNLPAAHKMDAPRYQEFKSAEIPVEVRQNGTRIKVIAGVTNSGTKGVIDNQFVLPTYWDISLPATEIFEENVEQGHAAFIYVHEGSVNLLDDKNTSLHSVKSGQLVILGDGDSIKLSGNNESSRFILVAGKPLKETVARHGPFVMNTQAEIQQAFQDYQNGVLA